MKTAHDLVRDAKARVEELSIDDAEQALSQVDVVIDVREPDEYRQGHIPGAVNMPRGLLEFSIGARPELEPRDRKLLLYCKTNGRGVLAARSLQEMGYLHVQTIAGGIDAWTEAGKAVSTPQELDYN